MSNNDFMLPRIFHSAPLTSGTTIMLTGGAATHIGKVLRLREHDTVILFNGQGLDYTARIISITRFEIVVSIAGSTNPETESPLRVSLLQGICRNNRMDLLIQKSTELGVQRIRPIIAERSVIRLNGERAEKKLLHWQNVAISACEQSGRARVPDISRPERLAAVCERLAATATLLVLDPAGGDIPATEIRSAHSIELLVGPEGGLTDKEREMASNAGFRQVRLGPRIMRTETAPLAALSILQYLSGDFSRR
jgi:16S rRNA (uracil1498-N3)-methyltransferase